MRRLRLAFVAAPALGLQGSIPRTQYVFSRRRRFTPACATERASHSHARFRALTTDSWDGAHGLGNTAGVPKDLDVVLTHSTADFDSLAAAVGLAKLRGGSTVVVTPGGESPAVRRFLSLHRQLFKIVKAHAVDPQRLRWVGIVDTVRSERLGIAADWPMLAEQVEVYDHHVGSECDIRNDNLTVVVEAVGAVATMICERLRAAAMELTAAEATLLALAIHSDTGSLTFEYTTARDVQALGWLMSQGAMQRSIAEFSHTMLTDEQQSALSTALAKLERHSVNGVEVASLMLHGRTFLKGMSAVANDVLQIANVDVLVLAYLNSRGRRGRRGGGDEELQLSIIGRARARVDGVDLGALLRALGGGGHARAASASLRATEGRARRIVQQLVADASRQIPRARAVAQLMSTALVTVGAAVPLARARALMALHGHETLPVVDGRGALLGLISAHDVRLAERRRGAEAADASPVGAWMHQNVVSVPPSTPFHEAARIVAEDAMGMVPVVEDGRLVGVITRMDVLLARRLVPEGMMHRHRRWT